MSTFQQAEAAARAEHPEAFRSAHPVHYLTQQALVALAARPALRTRRGRAHLQAPGGVAGFEATVCGRSLSGAQVLPWGQTAPEDRCARCSKAAAA